MMTYRNMAIASVAYGFGCAVVAGNPSSWDKLKSVIEDENLHVSVRLKACDEAAQALNESTAREFLEIAAAWASRLELSKLTFEQQARDKNVAAACALLNNFVVRNLSSLEPFIKNHQPRLDFLVVVATRSYCSNEAKAKAIQRIASGSAPPAAPRRALLRIVADDAWRRHTELSGNLLSALDEAAYPALRELVRRSSDPDTFCYAAAAALSHFGDRDIRSDLESLVPAFDRKHRNFGGILVYYLWKIDVQNPPTKLLEYIVAPPQQDTEKRRWAIRRAVELGIPKPKIREAVLKHASLVQPAGKYHIRQGLASLKALCIELKVLGPGDLSDVAVASRTP